MNWDDIWRDKKYITDFSLRWLEFLAERSAHLPDSAKVLEAGCGSGEGIAVLAKEGRTAIGLDMSKEAVAKTALYKNVTALEGNNFALPFPDNFFDLVFNSGVIEHYKYPENVRQVKEMARVTKSGGEVIINVPNSLCFWYTAMKNILLFFRKWKFGYEEGYTLWRLKKTAGEAGLQVQGATGFLSMPPFATDDKEMLPLPLRKKLAGFEKYLPLKQYYCYSVCALCRKN